MTENYATICSNLNGIHKKQFLGIVSNGGSFKLTKNGDWAVEIIADKSQYLTVKLVHKIDKLGETIKQTWHRTKKEKVIVEKIITKEPVINPEVNVREV